ncbi:uncharacterized protein LOC118749929 [Rhagoletis pomonella]|uniref:uncharacterized protein LOC118749926 n=1 Tax=Rhagoletis pomonella TaxID=28610 RepID=UPI00177DD6F4|nr:uncharacterized protein LOC118749926 [Rhagoletis pomonella]XP_036340584.1 uncharacterized protein LOC118749929 [Rhagoletis pomonella]XP_036340585.1 uncharacterized protein LOC118749929 [Rhagoletis pomonella]XP_036340586.1 uncharacterized protein LOC118749929 [Rhagoletis pomonella]XP_036340587.1 uncharacterized protein LOC118749929 [Rhagoletis pomonella]
MIANDGVNEVYNNKSDISEYNERRCEARNNKCLCRPKQVQLDSNAVEISEKVSSIQRDFEEPVCHLCASFIGPTKAVQIAAAISRDNYNTKLSRSQCIKLASDWNRPF